MSFFMCIGIDLARILGNAGVDPEGLVGPRGRVGRGIPLPPWDGFEKGA